ncbi:efflux RND transporter periplasmic adaptor subunit [Methylococcus sp. ANG]|uniref:efflux RND transporter periplasmic adaptor subunit n=1 Tax=unclassified Methylococcus TaxID=2618889 RepID=UPI001C52C273|nr:efflux RND transporter periplasmic adaptor subunit [Methylococcus sp. Mc7]QXP83094.1 efflux RND transporter periplasmic adaptor subunit [Methylococcus sp. Mc7]
MRFALAGVMRVALLAGAAVFLWSCHGEPEPERSEMVHVEVAAKAAPQESTEQDSSVVTAPPDLMKRLRIEVLSEGELHEPLRVPGRVSIEEFSRLARIGATVTGRITHIDASVGQRVKRGQKLAVLNSTEFSDTQRAFLKALAQKQLHAVIVERARKLYKSGVISELEFQRRASELSQAETEYNAMADQLQVLGMSDESLALLEKNRSIQPLVPVASSIDGIVMERNVSTGLVVQPADVLFVVADLSQLWIVAEVPEQQAEWARVGQQVEAEIPALSDRRVKGHLVYIAPTVDPETRTVTVRMEVANPDGSLKPEMLATMLISGKVSRLPMLPAEAVVREGDQDAVFVPLGDGRFRIKPVALGKEIGGQRPVLSGLSAGDEVVTEGSFHLNNERLRKELEQ